MNTATATATDINKVLMAATAARVIITMRGGRMIVEWHRCSSRDSFVTDSPDPVQLHTTHVAAACEQVSTTMARLIFHRAHVDVRPDEFQKTARRSGPAP